MFTRYHLLLLVSACLFSNASYSDIRKGDKLQVLANLHPDMKKSQMYSMNYQLSGVMIPVCAEVTIKKVKKKAMVFEWNGRKFSYLWDKHTRKSGIPLATSINDFFGSKCDQDKIDSMSDIDKKGIKKGIALVGMTREAVLIAMGRPPYHVNPVLESSTWMYWKNRFAKRAVTFDEKGIVIGVR